MNLLDFDVSLDVISQLSTDEKREVLKLLEAKKEYLKYNKKETLFRTEKVRTEDYPKHIQFMHEGIKYRSRLLCAGNRIGKTVTGAYEVTCHLTGVYPDWWTGKRFDTPITCWVAGESSISTRDVLQFELLGAYNDLGSGMIPKQFISGRPKTKSGVAECVDTIRIKNINGGESTLVFKSYEQGRSKFQGTALHVFWGDEEIPDEVYEECIYRTATTKGIVLLTYTPFKGYTETIKQHSDPQKESKFIMHVGWDNGGNMPHLTEEAKKELLESTHPAFIEVRTQGIPSLGAGAVYPVPERDIIVDDFPIPKTWRKMYGMDVGWNKTAVIWGAIDDNDIIYCYSEHYAGRQEPPVHAEAVRSRGSWIHGVIDPASRGRNQKDGTKLFDEYQNLGLNLGIANNAVHAGIQIVWQLMISGKLKIMRSLTNTLAELRVYQFDDNGKIKKQNDHLMDCFTKDTEVITDKGIYQIGDLVGTEGNILTLNGEYVPYKNCELIRKNSDIVEVMFSDGYVVKCTPDHLFLTNEGWVQAIDLEGKEMYNKVSQTINRDTLCIQSKLYQKKNKDFKGLFIGNVANTFKDMELDCTEKSICNTTISKKFPKVIMYIIKTAINRIMSLKILNYYHNLSIFHNTTREIRADFQNKLLNKHVFGMAQKQGKNGINNITKNLNIFFIKRLKESVQHAVKNILQLKLKAIHFATTIANQFIDVKWAWIMNKENAVYVKQNLRQTNIQKLEHVVKNVPLFCKKVQLLNEKQDTYCLEVPSTHAFALKNGVIAHNCLRYMCVSGREIATTNILTLDNLLYNEQKEVYHGSDGWLV